MNNAKEEKIYFLGLNQKTLIQALVGASVFLVFCHFLGLTVFAWSLQWERMFNLDFENNIPTWFSSLLWVGAAFFGYNISQYSLDRRRKFAWRMLALFFLYLSCDEAASIHENLGLLVFRSIFRSLPQEVANVRTCALLFGPLAAFLLVWIGYQLRADFRKEPKMIAVLAVGAGIFLMGSAGFEFVSQFIVKNEAFNLINGIEIILEESFEMFGAILINFGLLMHFEVVSRRGTLCQG